jgi:hypothetical protein
MSLLSDPTCTACGIKEELGVGTSFYMRMFNSDNTKNSDFRLTGASEYERMSAGSFVQFAEKSGRFETHGLIKLQLWAPN